MSIETIGDGIKANLQNISRVKASIYAPKELPDNIPDDEFILIMHRGTDFDQSGGGSNSIDVHQFVLLVGVSRQDQPSAMTRVLPYLEKTGDTSIRAKLLADTTLGGVAQEIINIRTEGQGGFTWGGVPYLGTRVEFTVYE